MKALSLMQPWASALFVRRPDGKVLKSIETRSWKTNVTGRIAIHASKGFPPEAREFAASEYANGRLPNRLPFGAIIGFVTIMGMRMTDDIAHQIDPIEKLYGDYYPGRWAWMLCDPEPIPNDKIITISGKLGLWSVEDALVAKRR